MRQVLAIVGLIALLVFASAMAFVRLAPNRQDDWHVRPQTLVPDSAGWRNWVLYPPGDTGGPVLMPRGAYALKVVGGTTATEAMRRLDRLALATPRTHRLAGVPEDGLITWVTRSAVWGFPDVTTAEALQDGQMVRIELVARQRFGTNDHGVNAARLRLWLAGLDHPD